MSIAFAGVASPLRIVPPEPMSLETFLCFSDQNPDLRLEREPNGELLLMSPTDGGAGYRSTRVLGQLFTWAEQDGTGYVLDSSTRALLPDGSVRIADAAWISAKRWTPPALSNDAPLPFPDFVIEVRSGSDSLPKAQAKMLEWIGNGVQLAWFVDPVRRVVEIYRSGHEPEIHEGQSVVHGEEPVAGFVLDLTKLWS